MPRTPILALIVAAVVAVVAAPGFVKLNEPNSDGLFYEVQRLQVEGHSEADATREVFDGAIARQTAEIEDAPSNQVRVLDPAWVEFSKQFYERRWLVPGVAAALAPIVGEHPGRALRWASLIGYLLVAPVLFLLLRRRFPPGLSAAIAVACTLAPPAYKWSLGQRVDSWGLMLEALGLLSAVLVKDLGRRWLLLWVATIAALSFTRDASVILLPAVAWLLFVERREPEARKTNLALLGTGVAAALPAFILGGAPLRVQLAYVISGFNIPDHTSWSFVVSNYPEQLWRTISTDLSYPVDFSIPVAAVLYVGLALAAVTLVVVAARPAGRDPYFALMKAAIPGGIVLLLLANNPQAYRLELVFVPVAAVGLALMAEWALALLRSQAAARAATLA